MYSSVVEIPVRAATSAPEQVDNWHRVFPIASGFLKTFGLLSLPLIILAGVLHSNWLWYLSAFFMVLLIPFTAKFIAVSNTALMAIKPENGDAASTLIIEQWARLHHIRTVLSVLGFLAGTAAVTFF